MIEKACWLLLALIHLPPAMALLRPVSITALYGVSSSDPSFLLLHHRAALFVGVAAACIWAIFDARVAGLAAAITALSMLSFLALYFGYGQPAALKSIAIADAIGLPLLLYVGWRAAVN